MQADVQTEVNVPICAASRLPKVGVGCLCVDMKRGASSPWRAAVAMGEDDAVQSLIFAALRREGRGKAMSADLAVDSRSVRREKARGVRREC